MQDQTLKCVEVGLIKGFREAGCDRYREMPGPWYPDFRQSTKYRPAVRRTHLLLGKRNVDLSPAALG